jgi:hypothetical protein
VLGELATAPEAVRDLLLGSMFAWLAAFGAWSALNFGIYLSPRSDGKPG